MRSVLGVAALLLLSGCGSTPKKQTNSDYEDRIEALLKARPDDPDLLFLRQDKKNVDRRRQMVALRPTSLVLALEAEWMFDDYGIGDRLDELKKHLKHWSSKDPGNAAPRLMLAQTILAQRDLKAALRELEAASTLPSLRSLNGEWSRELHRIQKQEGFTDVTDLLVPYGRIHGGTRQAFLTACRVLESVSDQGAFRNQVQEAVRWSEVEYRLASRFSESAVTSMESWYACWRESDAAARLCELHLRLRNERLAAEWAAKARKARIDWLVLECAIRKDLAGRSPVSQALRKDKPPAESAEGQVEQLLDFEETDRFHWKLRKNESETRPHMEAVIARGELAVLLERVTRKEREEVASSKLPIDVFMEERQLFYPEKPGEESRARLLAHLTASWSEDDIDRVEFLQERALRALLHQADPQNAPALSRALSNPRKEGPSHSTQAAVALSALGHSNEPVLKALESDFDVYTDKICWAWARLGRSECVATLIKSLESELSWGGSGLTDEFGKAAAMYFALRDLTGQDFGIDQGKWKEWGKTAGVLKE